MTRTNTTNYQADPVGTAGGSTVFAWASSADDYFSRTADLANLALALERHTHADGRGLAVSRFAAGSINPATDMVINPIFPGTVTINGSLSVLGTSFLHATQITGTLNVSGLTTISSGSNLALTGGSIIGAGPIAGTSLAITGSGSFAGTLIGVTTFNCTTISAVGAITSGSSISATTALNGASLGITGNAVIGGNLTVNTGFVNIATGALIVAGNISNVAGGMDIHGTTNLNNNLTVFGQTGFLGNVGFRANINPESGFTPNLGAVGLPWATTYTNDLRVNNTMQVNGNTDLANTSVNGTLGVFNNAGFSLIQPRIDNTYSCGAPGAPGLRWTAVYAVNGTIQTSSIDVKEHLTPLDTKLALRVALETKLHEFQYRTPDGEGGLKSLKTAKPRRERQVGFMAEDSHPLLLVAEDGVNGQNTASVALGAIQELAAQVEALTARLKMLEG